MTIMKWTKSFALFLALSLFASIWPVMYAQEKTGKIEVPLTLEEILTGLPNYVDTPETRTLARRNLYITKLIRKRGVDFSLTLEVEKKLRKAGATSELLKAIRENLEPVPKPVLIPTPKPKPTLTPKPAESERVVIPNTYSENLNGVSLEMIQVPKGEFMMGSDKYDSEKPLHLVTVSSFYIGKYEVTQKQWKAVMGNNPSYFKGDDLPVEMVSWEDVQEFCLKLNRMNIRRRFRLPTEAEWEYACRAGTKGSYAGSLNEMAWYSQNAGSKTHPIGQKKANAFGLYDMHGNIWEWCQDSYSHYSSQHQENPTSPKNGVGQVLRGGSWYEDASNCRSTRRRLDIPSDRQDDIGFRVVVESNKF